MAASPAPLPLTALALLVPLALLFTSQGATVGKTGGVVARRQAGYVPVSTVVYRSAALPAATTTSVDDASGGGSGGGGGGYEPFELCMGCRCCSAANASSCVDTSCCYAIDCNIPGKPFGVCAFTPRTCDCGGAGAGSNCTQ